MTKKNPTYCKYDMTFVEYEIRPFFKVSYLDIDLKLEFKSFNQMQMMLDINIKRLLIF